MGAYQTANADDGEKGPGNEYYAGGSQSGQAIIDPTEKVRAIMIVPLYMENLYRPCYSSSSPRSRQDKDIFKRLQEKAKENMDSSPDMPMDEVRAGIKMGGGRGGSAARSYLYRAPRKG